MTARTQTVGEIAIGGRRIGGEQPPYLIAELSANHNGSFDTACAILRAAARAGADAVKLQTYTADTITLDCRSADFRIDSGPWAGRYLYDLYQEAHTPWDWHGPLFELGRELGVSVFSSPFDETAVDFLEELGAPAYKIASFELTHLPLIRKAAATGKPLVMSTGMANLAEIGEGLAAARDAGATQIVLLHCISGYPTPPDEANLRAIPALAREFGVPVGLSDHTQGTTAATAAVALGACAIEKHVTLDRSEQGLDADFSLEPAELADLRRAVDTAHSALGTGEKQRAQSETGTAAHRRSIYVARDVKAGETLGPDNVRVVRPGYGLAPRHWEAVLGRRAARDLAHGTPLDWSMVE